MEAQENDENNTQALNRTVRSGHFAPTSETGLCQKTEMQNSRDPLPRARNSSENITKSNRDVASQTKAATETQRAHDHESQRKGRHDGGDDSNRLGSHEDTAAKELAPTSVGKVPSLYSVTCVGTPTPRNILQRLSPHQPQRATFPGRTRVLATKTGAQGRGTPGRRTRPQLWRNQSHTPTGVYTTASGDRETRARSTPRHPVTRMVEEEKGVSARGRRFEGDGLHNRACGDSCDTVRARPVRA